jgi:hypothetical protein
MRLTEAELMSDEPTVTADLIESMDPAPEKTVTLRARDGTFQTFRAVTRPHAVIDSSLAHFAAKTQRQIDGLLGTSNWDAWRTPIFDLTSTQLAINQLLDLERMRAQSVFDATHQFEVQQVSIASEMLDRMEVTSVRHLRR